MEYSHTQHGRIHHIIGAVAIAFAAWAVLVDQAFVQGILASVGCLVFLVSFMFHWLRVSDDGDDLLLQYGPLPVFRKRIHYAEITSAEKDRSSVIDGWGIHYVLGRGWTYNLWGFDCVKLQVKKQVIRVGTDDVDRLVECLQQKIGRPA